MRDSKADEKRRAKVIAAAIKQQSQTSSSMGQALPKMEKKRSKKRRLRKSKSQREALWGLFKSLKGG